MPASIAWNRKPLPMNAFAPLPLTAVRPKGWLREAVEASGEGDLDGRLARAGILEEPGLMKKALAEAEGLLSGEECLEQGAVRALMRYHGMTGDKQALLRLMRHAKEQMDTLPGTRLPPERAVMPGEFMHMAIWLYNLTGQKALLDLCHMLKAQAPDWMSTLHIFSQTRPVEIPSHLAGDAYWRVHGEAIAASFQVPSLQALFEGGLKNETAFQAGWDKAMRHHGAAHGLFNADPLLAGANPSRGVAPAVVSNMLLSLETMAWTLGLPACGELMETIAYNALPAAVGVQAANQLQARDGDRAGGLAQFAAAQWMASQDDGLAAIGYAPCEVRWRLGGQPVRLEINTDYPYGDSVEIHFHLKGQAEFPLHLRIPSWAKGATAEIEGEAPVSLSEGAFERLSRTWRDGDRLTLRLPMEARLASGYHQSVWLQRGPLTYALPLQEETIWNVALLPEHGFEWDMQAGIPVAYANVATVDAWRRKGDAPGLVPIAPLVKPLEVRRVQMTPYGKTTARIAQFPVGRLE